MIYAGDKASVIREFKSIEALARSESQDALGFLMM
jgi:hypothetical protein